MVKKEDKICMPKRLVIGAIIGAAVLVAVAFYLGSRLPGQSIWPPGGLSGLYGGGTEPQSVTRAEVPSDITVPGAGATNVPDGMAVPKTEVQAAPGVDSKLRAFDISVNRDEFSPSTVAVNVGDTVHINLTAVDKDYDFTQPDYGFNMPLPKGVKKVLEFQVSNEGKFTFYCKSCGGPDKGPVGYIIVVNK